MDSTDDYPVGGDGLGRDQQTEHGDPTEAARGHAARRAQRSEAEQRQADVHAQERQRLADQARRLSDEAEWQRAADERDSRERDRQVREDRGREPDGPSR